MAEPAGGPQAAGGPPAGAASGPMGQPPAADRWSRRRLLFAAGGGLIIGAAAAEAGNLLSAPGTTYSAATPPGETLMYEHGVLKRVLLIYATAGSRAATDPALAAAAIRSGAQIIHDFIEDFHEALEEGYVFPLLRAAGSNVATIDTLLLQHARGRLITQLLLAQIRAEALAEPVARQRLLMEMNAFIRMYEPHEAREDTVIFPALRAALTPRQLAEYGETFDRLQTKQFGPNGFADTVAKVAEIERSLGIYDLAQFTPAAVAPAAS